MFKKIVRKISVKMFWLDHALNASTCLVLVLFCFYVDINFDRQGQEKWESKLFS